MSTSIVLICAVLASLAAGVFLAYAVCLTMFSLFRAHVRQMTAHKQVGLPVRVAHN